MGCLGILLVSADPRVLRLASNTLWLGIGSCAWGVPPGAFLALVLCRTDLPFRRFLFFITFSLLFLPLLVHAAAWEAALGKLGWYTVAASAPATPQLYGLAAVMWIHGVWSIPWVTCIVAAALQGSPRELEEAALLDASPVAVLRHVTWPQARPGVVTACVWVLLVSSTEIVVADLYQVRTLAEEIYTGFALADDPASTFGFGTVWVATGMVIGAAMMMFDTLLGLVQPLSGRAPWRFRLGRGRAPALLLVGLLMAVLVLVPVGSLVYQVGLVVRGIEGSVIRTWSFGRCLELLVPGPSTYAVSVLWEFRRAWLWTLLMSTSAATLAVAVAAPLAWLGRGGGLRALPGVLLAAVGLATMGPLVGVFIIQLFTISDHPAWIWFYDCTILAPVLAAAFRSLPVTILICWFAMRGLSPQLTDAARIDGAGPWARFWQVGVASCYPALAVAWLVALALACGELSATILVVPPGVTTVTLRIFGLLHAGVTNQAAALSLTMLGAVFAVSAVMHYLLSRLRAESSYRVPSPRVGGAEPPCDNQTWSVSGS